MSTFNNLLDSKWGGSILLAAVVCFCVLAALISIKYLGKHNIVETVAEEVIKIETGKSVDFSQD
jgi:hypothetical protein